MCCRTRPSAFLFLFCVPSRQPGSGYLSQRDAKYDAGDADEDHAVAKDMQGRGMNRHESRGDGYEHSHDGEYGAAVKSLREYVHRFNDVDCFSEPASQPLDGAH